MTDDQPNQSGDDALADDDRWQSIRAAANELTESLKNPKPDHYGTFHPVYKVVNAILRSRFARRLPPPITKPFEYLLHVIMIHDTYKRMLAGEKPYAEKPFIVRPGMNVSIPALFIIELFPPSEIDNLERSLKRNSWNSSRIKKFIEAGPALTESRSGGGYEWWHLGAVARRHSRRHYMDGSVGRLPRGIDGVSLKAFQIGQGITAVLARVDTTEAGAAQLDRVWHRLFLPRIDWGAWGGAWPQAQGAQWVAFRQTQLAHARIHRRARKWLRKQCPGVFASNGYPQPLLDVLLFDGVDAPLEASSTRDTTDALRALGLSTDSIVQRSDQLPAMVLADANDRLDSNVDTRGTWSLWGGRSALFGELSGIFDHYGMGASDNAVAYWVQESIESFFIRLSISELLKLCQIRYASIRDSARRTHGRYRMKHLKQLRSNLLTLSLDLSSIDRDVRAHNDAGGRFDQTVITMEEAPWSARRDAEEGYAGFEPVNLNESLIARQARMLDALAVADRNYREILTSAASLTSSMQSLRAGTAAIWVALASLVVAGMTLMLTTAPEHTTLDLIVQFVRDRIN